MAEYIERQAAIDAVLHHGEIENDYTDLYRDGYCDGVYDSADILKELPSAQPEQKKGKWIIHPEVKNVYGGTCIECSECGEKYVVQYIDDEKFCRNCGADMRGEQDE